MQALVDDFHYSVRVLRKNPGPTAASVFILALAVGASVAIFGLIDVLLFVTPEHVVEPQHVLTVGKNGIEWFDYQNVADHIRSMTVAAHSGRADRTLGTGIEAQPVQVDFVTSAYFRLLGVKPLFGRGLSVEDETVGGEMRAVVSYRAWRRLFDSAPNVIGTVITLSNTRCIIIGVAPDGFTGVDLNNIDFWIAKAGPAIGNGGPYALNWVHIVGRMQPGGTLDQIRDELASLMPGTVSNLVDASGKPVPLASLIRLNALAEPFLTRLSSLDTALVSMSVAGIILLFIGCSNYASMLLNRSFRRNTEIVVRMQLGATPARIVRQLGMESILIGAACSIVSVVFVYWATPVLRGLFVLPVPEQGFLNWRIVAAVFLTSSMCAVLSTLAVALFVYRGRGKDHRGGSALRSGLLIVQVAFTAMILVAATLTVRSLQNTLNLPYGVRSQNVLLASPDLNRAGFTPEEQRAVLQQMIFRATGLPDVVAVSPSLMLPYEGGRMIPWSAPGHDSPYFTSRNPSGHGSNPVANAVSPQYFDMLGMRILKGRGFLASDREGSPLVAIINEKMALDIWQDENPIGQCLTAGRATECRTIVGVVSSIRTSVRRNALLHPDEVDPAFYIPFEQSDSSVDNARLLIAVRGISAGSLRSIRQSLQTVNPRLSYVRIEPMSNRLDDATRQWMVGAMLFSVFGAIATALAVMGIFGMLAVVMQQRTREIGIRFTVGATRQDILALALKTGLIPVAIGIAVGLLLAFGLTRFLTALLFGVQSTDPRSFVTAAVFLTVAGLAGCLIPALRSSRIDPAALLRCD